MISQVADAEALLSDLVGFASISGLPNGDIVSYIKSYLESYGVEVYLDGHEDDERFNLFATIGPRIDGGIVLSGHLDVVPANPTGWLSDPFILHKEDGRLYGRGAVDMKGFLAVVLAMVPAFIESADQLSVPVHFAFTFDEEVGSFGAAQMPAFLDRIGIKPAIALIGEPTDMKPIIGHKGGLELTATIRGTAGHASDPRDKVNALYYAARLICYLDSKGQMLAATPRTGTPFDPPYTTISVGHVEGGEARNIVADHCRFLWEIRPLPDENPYVILAEVQDFVDKELVPNMRTVHPEAGIDLIVESWCPGMQTCLTSPAVNLVSRLWTNDKPGVVSFGTDGGHFQAAGMETIVFGPGGVAQMHQPNEFIEIGALAEGLIFLDKLLEHIKLPVQTL